jgi:hypothetical protein
MIRRAARLDDGSAGWMLISQPAHAGVSAQLAEVCREDLLFLEGPLSAEGSGSHEQVRGEVLGAIRIHDDGWTEHDRDIARDLRTGRPIGFTDLSLPEALAIWSRCVSEAEAIGPFAAWMVGGHFSRLIARSDHFRREAAAGQWLRGVADRRSKWFTRWRASRPQLHTMQLAETALQWLWTFDELSLWLCCDCEPGREASPPPPRLYVAGQGTPLETTLADAADSPASSGRKVGVVDPWIFDVPYVDLTVPGVVVPAEVPTSFGAEPFDGHNAMSLLWRLEPPATA